MGPLWGLMGFYEVLTGPIRAYGVLWGPYRVCSPTDHGLQSGVSIGAELRIESLTQRGQLRGGGALRGGGE